MRRFIELINKVLLMNIIKLPIKITLFIVLFPLAVSAAPIFDEIVNTFSLAHHIHLFKKKDPVDGGWLPDLTGLPTQAEVELLTKHVLDVMNLDKDKSCTAMNASLRQFVFQHFLIYQQLANSQGTYFDDQTAHQWAHILAMVDKESGGDSTNITDMSGHSITTNQPNTDLLHWRQILNLTQQNRIQFNYQTNFGLTQTSADRLFTAFTLAQNQKYNKSFLEGKEGALTPVKQDLNTVIAIRRLIWFYQDFAQGRIAQSDRRIHQQDIGNPEFFGRYQAGLKMALLYCGTRFMFRNKHEGSSDKSELDLESAMATIAYCKFGNAQSGYGKNEFDEKCFAEWVTLCPALNVDIATLTPLSYFATRNVSPVCENTFKQLLTKKPS